ncbi:MAG: tetraacyldisaccharide 4'-kinase [Candidatus Omnitrophica bacterium]|nr:tetraacyldisaccharide 4'-kinase [Candidatus Omnitrophota bacterium]MDD5236963.1 tetraacyldisaccharide 4'-kinase [Candidatus Omnitrophota bacterium]MDD5610928.1 tetraacyldisaccharide 4'-kinase [Candidatus Omnitrophota bacterium]
MKDYFYAIITGDKKKGYLASFTRACLLLMSLCYRITLLAIKSLYKLKLLNKQRLNAKVISVGNITWGGTGKTPLVAYIGFRLKKDGRKVAVLTRGYKRKYSAATSVSYNGMDLDSRPIGLNEAGDEALLLSAELSDVPIGIAADRAKAARVIIEKFHPDTFILDDGFQHWRLMRDLDIVAIDATNPFGNGHIMPWGIMREPRCALKRADIFVLTKTNVHPDTAELKTILNKINPGALIVEARYDIAGLYAAGDLKKDMQDVSRFRNRAVACVSSIANPEAFEKMLSGAGMNVARAFRYSDHYHYAKKDVQDILDACQVGNISEVITTEKDLVRLKDYLPDNGAVKFFVLKISMNITQDEAFFKRIYGIY